MIICNCTLSPHSCQFCSNRPFLETQPLMGSVPQLKFEFTEHDKRQLAWVFHSKQFATKIPCVYFRNVNMGLDCSAKNCPCDLYEADE